jgi:copper chaperone CopZ
VERALKALPGVVAAQASYPDKLAAVEYDSRKVGLDDMVKALLQAGFAASRP